MKQRIAAFGLLALCASAAWAQEQGLYSTKKNPEHPLPLPRQQAPASTPFAYQNPQGQAAQPSGAVGDSPQQRFVPSIPAGTPGLLTGGTQGTPNHYQPTVPFGHASPEALVPLPKGPRTTTSAPVEGIESGEVEVADPATITSADVPPAQKDPSAPTPQTGAIFVDEGANASPREMVLRGLNKVNAMSQELHVMVGDTVRFGQLEITPRACRTSTPESLPESAALLEVKELPAGAGHGPEDAANPPEPAKEIFDGWMFASSPSLNGLEHPVYDISVISCGKEKQQEKAEVSKEN